MIPVVRLGYAAVGSLVGALLGATFAGLVLGQSDGQHPSFSLLVNVVFAGSGAVGTWRWAGSYLRSRRPPRRATPARTASRRLLLVLAGILAGVFLSVGDWAATIGCIALLGLFTSYLLAGRPSSRDVTRVVGVLILMAGIALAGIGIGLFLLASGALTLLAASIPDGRQPQLASPTAPAMQDLPSRRLDSVAPTPPVPRDLRRVAVFALLGLLGIGLVLRGPASAVAGHSAQDPRRDLLLTVFAPGFADLNDDGSAQLCEHAKPVERLRCWSALYAMRDLVAGAGPRGFTNGSSTWVIGNHGAVRAHGSMPIAAALSTVQARLTTTVDTSHGRWTEQNYTGSGPLTWKFQPHESFLQPVTVQVTLAPARVDDAELNEVVGAIMTIDVEVG